MSADPAVSVVLPTYNRSHVLGRAVRSVLGQTFSDLELIVVDDGSTDDTTQLLASFDDPRLIHVVIEHLGSAAAVRNEGIKRARADWIAFQDSDDVWLIDKLERQMRVLETQPDDLALLCGGYIVISRQGQVYYQGASSVMQSGDWDAGNLYDFTFITPTWLARREHLMKEGMFDERMPNLEDWELALRLRARHRVMAMNEALVVKYGSHDSLNSLGEARIQSIQRLLDKYDAELKCHPSVGARLMFDLARVYCLAGDMQAGRRAILGALCRRPHRLKYWLALAAAMMGERAYSRLWRLRAGSQ